MLSPGAESAGTGPRGLAERPAEAGAAGASLFDDDSPEAAADEPALFSGWAGVAATPGVVEPEGLGAYSGPGVGVRIRVPGAFKQASGV